MTDLVTPQPSGVIRSDVESDVRHPTLHEPLLSQMKRLFTLNLRADQKRIMIHQHMQQPRYMDVFVGPSFDRVQHWNHSLRRVEHAYQNIEKECKQYVGVRVEADEEGRPFVDGKAVHQDFMVFVEKVKDLADEIERLLEEIGD